MTVAAFGVAYAAGRGLIVPLGAAAPTVAQEAIGVAVLVAILVLFGLYRGSRRELWRSLQQEADLARREQAAADHCDGHVSKSMGVHGQRSLASCFTSGVPPGPVSIK